MKILIFNSEDNKKEIKIVRREIKNMIKNVSQKLKTTINENTIKNKSNENKCNNQTVWVAYHATRNAITLIALVITIIVLLILAGVTINLVLGPEGLLKQAQDATNKYKQAENEELNSMSNLLAQLEEINNGTGGGTPDNPEKPVAPSTAKPGEIIKTENNIKYTSDGEGNVIPVPEGFTYVGEGTKDIGFVIKNDEDLNEFVWVPVKDMPYTYDRYALLSTQPADGIDTATNSTKIKYSSLGSHYFTEAMPVDEQTSVNTYGGYYIARYEAGILEKRTAKGEATTLPIFKKSTNEQKVYVYNYVTRDEAKSLAEGLYNKAENNATSKLCSSYAWDTALKFIETKNEGWVTNSIGGNYDTSSGGIGQLQPIGYHSVNNIYDMGGNAVEWTTETYSSTSGPCVNRGGSYVSTVPVIPAAYRSSSHTSVAEDYNGFRVTLYL